MLIRNQSIIDLCKCQAVGGVSFSAVVDCAANLVRKQLLGRAKSERIDITCCRQHQNNKKPIANNANRMTATNRHSGRVCVFVTVSGKFSSTY